MVLCCAGLLGMRTRSEPAVLRWENVDFDKNLISIPAVKTKVRITPLYADAKTVLMRYWDFEGCPSDGLVFPRLHAGATLFTKTSTVFGRKISKPLQRLRSSCETYLVNEAGFALTDVSRWLGHNPATALRYFEVLQPKLASNPRKSYDVRSIEVQSISRYLKKREGIEALLTTLFLKNAEYITHRVIQWHLFDLR